MDTSTITAETNSVVASQRANTVGFADLNSEDFFALLIAELQSQDPLNPQDNQQLLNQMSSIRQMEQNATLTSTLESLAGEQRFGATAGLIGHYVLGTVADQSGQPIDVEGVVIGVSFERDGDAILELHNGHSVPASKVREVTLVENLPPDILAQLEAELEALGGGPDAPPGDPDAPPDDPPGDGGEPAGGGGGAGRLIIPDATPPKTTVGRYGREVADRVNIVAELLDGLFSPGIGIGVGS
ncbi:MAG: flagellar hook assembly protein FlgD [Phycisphaerae bacterium]